MRGLRGALPLGMLVAAAAQSPVPLQPFDSQWTATDALGRTLPTAAQVGPPRGKIVGVFYWLWHGYLRNHPILDVSTELANNPGNPQWVFQDWYHGLPEAGYYHSGDKWVARRNLQMLANAGVDFIFFDWTNGPVPSDPTILYSFLDVAEEMLAAGIPVPRFCFFLNSAASTTFDWINTNVYSQGKYQNLWFLWEGKPLVMSGDLMPDRQQQLQAFTLRRMWAFGTDTQDYWRFIDQYPQRPSIHGGAVEQICVGKAEGAPAIPPGGTINKGSSFRFQDGRVPNYNAQWIAAETPLGLYFEEQWQRAKEVDPQIVTVTGWNEWLAGAWHPDGGMVGQWTFMGKVMTQGGYFFVDEFNAEFNRDIEPMVGGYTDNYYYQLVAHVRAFKGLPASEGASPPQTVPIDGSFGEWQAVRPIFRDPPGDIAPRSFQNVDASATLTDNWGRNDIVESRMTHDGASLYAYARTAAALTAPTPGSWMSLYVDVDANPATGWLGFDFATLYTGTPGQFAVLKYAGEQCNIREGVDCVGGDLRRVDVTFSAEQCCDLCKAEPGCAAWSWDNGSSMACYLKSGCANPVSSSSVSGSCGNNEWSIVGTATFAYSGAELEVALPKALLGVAGAPRVNFKWRDNNGHMSSVAEMLSTGAEAAPDRRFSYPYAGVGLAEANATAWI